MDRAEDCLARLDELAQEGNDKKRALAIEARCRFVQEQQGPTNISYVSDGIGNSSRLADELDADIQPLSLLNTEAVSSDSNQSILDILQLQ